MKQTIYSCDLCGKTNRYIPEGWIKIKGKERWYAYPDDRGWSRKKILLCDKCQHELKAIFTEENIHNLKEVKEDNSKEMTKLIEAVRDEFIKRKEANEQFSGMTWGYDDKVVLLEIEFIPKEIWD